MENLSLDKFNPGKAELTKLADKYRSIKIKGIDDTAGYEQASDAIKELVKVRRQIELAGKEYRAEALSFQRSVISLEKDLVEIIDPLEKDLKNQKATVDHQREMARRMKFLPHRKQVLAEIEFEAIREAYDSGALPDEFITDLCPTDEQIMQMDDDCFSEFVLDRKKAVLDAKTFLLQKREADIEKRRLADEAEQNRKKELEEAKEAGRKEAMQEFVKTAEPDKTESEVEYLGKQPADQDNENVFELPEFMVIQLDDTDDENYYTAVEASNGNTPYPPSHEHPTAVYKLVKYLYR